MGTACGKVSTRTLVRRLGCGKEDDDLSLETGLELSSWSRVLGNYCTDLRKQVMSGKRNMYSVPWDEAHDAVDE